MATPPPFLHQPPPFQLSPLSSKIFGTPPSPPSDSIFGRSYPPPPSFNKGVGSNYDNTEFFVVLDHFSPFLSTNNPENENFEKTKNPGDIIYHFTHLYHKYEHTMYGSSGMEHNRIFCHFGPFKILAETWVSHWVTKLTDLLA